MGAVTTASNSTSRTSSSSPAGKIRDQTTGFPVYEHSSTGLLSLGSQMSLVSRNLGHIGHNSTYL
jgi:hypothetical protein